MLLHGSKYCLWKVVMYCNLHFHYLEVQLDKSLLNLLVVEFWRVALWMIRMEDIVGGMNVFPWILMLFLTLACIAYPACRIQESSLFFEMVENPIV